jgi:putative hydrolase
LGSVADDDVPNPFTNPIFAQFQRAMSAQGPLQWDVARQTALMAATSGVAEHNVEPERRITVEQLARIVSMHVADVTGITPPDSTQIEVVNRATWVQRTLDAWRPFFDALAQALSTQANETDPAEPNEHDPMLAMLANVNKMIAPSMLGMSVGNLVGRLAVHTFGQYDLPLPREPHGRPLLVIGNVDAFAEEWSLPRDDMAVWALSNEFVTHTLFSSPSLRSAISTMVAEFARGFRSDPSAISDAFSRLDVTSGDPLKMLDSLLSDPTVLLGAQRSIGQDRVAPGLDAAMTAVVGFVDYFVDVVAGQLLGDASRIGEAVRRRRVAQSTDRVFVERLLGVDLTVERVMTARRFATGVIDRAGADALVALYERADALPTPAEIDAPGLWLARLEITE